MGIDLQTQIILFTVLGMGFGIWADVQGMQGENKRALISSTLSVLNALASMILIIQGLIN